MLDDGEDGDGAAEDDGGDVLRGSVAAHGGEAADRADLQKCCRWAGQCGWYPGLGVAGLAHVVTVVTLPDLAGGAERLAAAATHQPRPLHPPPTEASEGWCLIC